MPIPTGSLDVAPAVLLRVGGEVLDLAELGRLLVALQASPHVGGAAQALGVSYRGAWGKLVRAERLLGIALVERVKGHGSRLTAAGEAFAQASRRLEQAASRRLRSPAEQFRAVLESMHTLAERPLRIAASHDLLLQAVFSESAPANMSVRFVGSEDALLALRRGHAELAGFHLPEPLPALRERPEVFADPALFVAAVMRREQGLIVARGNPLRIRDVADLARSGLRFVNRQRGAGTRAWFDRLLRERGLSPAGIRGYEREEFTHYAVAASVAAGLADAGFGLRAAADQLGLDFISIGMERYYLCGLQHWRNHPRVRALIHELRARATRASGYARCRSVDGQAG